MYLILCNCVFNDVHLYHLISVVSLEDAPPSSQLRLRHSRRSQRGHTSSVSERRNMVAILEPACHLNLKRDLKKRKVDARLRCMVRRVPFSRKLASACPGHRRADAPAPHLEHQKQSPSPGEVPLTRDSNRRWASDISIIISDTALTWYVLRR